MVFLMGPLWKVTNSIFKFMRCYYSFVAADDRGVVSLPFLMMFITLMGFVGIGFDVARYESERSETQLHLDNALLAATTLRLEVKGEDEIEEMVSDYFGKAGLNGVKVVVNNAENIDNSRYVKVSANREISTIFMRIFGIKKLELNVKSAATEAVPNIEISLALDVGDSMDPQSFEAMKEASKSFISEMLAANSDRFPNRVSISLIPYHMQVNAGEELFHLINSDAKKHDHSYCIQWNERNFQSIGFSTPDMEHLMHYAQWNQSDRYGWLPISARSLGILDVPSCRTEEEMVVTPFSKDEEALHKQISALERYEGTSIGVAMKWASALLNPKYQNIVEGLTDLSPLTHKQAVDPSFSGRPASFDDTGTLKVIVIMTNGEINSSRTVKAGHSTVERVDVWHNPNSVDVDIMDRWDAEARYFELRQIDQRALSTEAKERVNREIGKLEVIITQGSDPYAIYEGPLHHTILFGKENPGNGWRQLTKAEMWGHVTLDRYAVEVGSNWQQFEETISEDEKVVRLESICEAVRQTKTDTNSGIKVFGISFLSPETGMKQEGYKQIRDCASNEGMFFRASNENIKSVFLQVASIVQKLRLTQ